MLDSLNPGQNSEYVASLNRSCDGFRERGQWHDPVYIGLSYFDIMVSSAACQGIRWHMWLYYFPIVLERLLAICDESGPAIDSSDEWPTRSLYLIYVVFSTVIRWTHLIKFLPPSCSHRSFNEGNVRHENDNIIKSAAIALGSCCDRIVTTDKVSEKFLDYIHDIVLSGIRDLAHTGDEGRLRKLLILSVIRRGPLGQDAQYGANLQRLWRNADMVFRLELDDYRDALFATYGGG